MSHTCHALDCTVRTKPEMLMCSRHWFMVPNNLQRLVWAAYRVGQCDDKRPSERWLKAADAAIGAVALKEGYLPGELTVSVVRALAELAPHILGADLQRIKVGLAQIDRRRLASSSE